MRARTHTVVLTDRLRIPRSVSHASVAIGSSRLARRRDTLPERPVGGRLCIGGVVVSSRNRNEGSGAHITRLCTHTALFGIQSRPAYAVQFEPGRRAVLSEGRTRGPPVQSSAGSVSLTASTRSNVSACALVSCSTDVARSMVSSHCLTQTCRYWTSVSCEHDSKITTRAKRPLGTEASPERARPDKEAPLYGAAVCHGQTLLG